MLPDDPNEAIPGGGHTFVIPTTPAQDAAIQNYLNARKANPGLYNLFGRNCVSFVRDALKAGGIPENNTIFPGIFVPDLNQRTYDNPPGLGRVPPLHF
jgi:hypothetical protein